MCGPRFCAMKITQDIRAYAESRGLAADGEALPAGMKMKEKAGEFAEHGGRIYLPVESA